MRRIIVAFVLMLIFVINADAQYQFDDEFGGTSVNLNNWFIYQGYNYNGNSESEYYLTANVTETGSLHILTDYASHDGYSYTSGYMQMKTFNFLYGTVTVKAQIPGGTTWPAIWLLGTGCQDPVALQSTISTCNEKWPDPNYDEIDIAEFLSSNSNGTAFIQVHQQIHDNNGSPECTASPDWNIICTGNDAPSSCCTGSDAGYCNASNSFHVYSLTWTSSALNWFVDGVNTCTTTDVSTTPKFLIIDTAVGGTGGATPSGGTGFPQTMLVDYVHVTTTSTPNISGIPVSPSAGANGSISPSSVVTVNPGSTTTFTVTPNAGYYASVGGSCGGSLSGSTYTTGEIIAPCTVTASFSATPSGPSATVPYAPTDVTATAGNGHATVSFKLPANGGSTITGYTVTSSPGGITASGAGSPITVNGLTNGTAYIFTVTATNAIGTSQASTPSNSVTPEGYRHHRR